MKTNFKNAVRYQWIYLAAVYIFLPACHYSSASETNKDSSGVSDNISTVLVSQVNAEDIQSNISISGVAEANQEVKVYAMSNGYVQSWKHDIGESVKKGEVLAVLANPELMQQQVKAQAEYNGDKSIYDRLEGVYKKTPELTPLQQVDEAKAKYECAGAQLNAINSQIEYLTVKAPFFGMITERYIDTGSVVQDGLSRANVDPLFKIQDISVIRVSVNVPEVNSPYILKGTNVKVIFPDLPNTGYDAKVSRISYGLSDDTKTMLAQVDITNKDGKIHPGMFANVVFEISSSPGVLCIANQSIVVSEQQPFVYKVVPVDSATHSFNWTQGVKCRLHKIKVQLGITNSNTSEVRYASLGNGDKIVVSGKNFCTDGGIVIARENGAGKNITSR